MSINQVNVKEERIENNYGDIENYNSLDSNYYDLLDPNKSVLKLLDERTSDVHMALPIFYDSFIIVSRISGYRDMASKKTVLELKISGF